MAECKVGLDARINALYDAETNAPMINDAINVLVNSIQKNLFKRILLHTIFLGI